MKSKNNIKIFIISDTHFNHEAIKNEDFENRPDNYNELIIKNWKKLVSEGDTVIHLWDVIFARAWELKDILWQLPWTKILVKGNHDMNRNNWYLWKWFNFVCDKIELRVNHQDVILTHKPVELKEWQFNIHWHLHSWRHRDEEFSDIITDNHILYSCELENYKPLLLESMINI